MPLCRSLSISLLFCFLVTITATATIPVETAAAAATTAAKASTTAESTSTAPILFGPGFIHCESTTFDLASVESGNCCISRFARIHLYKCESA